MAERINWESKAPLDLSGHLATYGNAMLKQNEIMGNLFNAPADFVKTAQLRNQANLVDALRPMDAQQLSDPQMVQEAFDRALPKNSFASIDPSVINTWLTDTRPKELIDKQTAQNALVLDNLATQDKLDSSVQAHFADGYAMYQTELGQAGDDASRAAVMQQYAPFLEQMDNLEPYMKMNILDKYNKNTNNRLSDRKTMFTTKTDINNSLGSYLLPSYSSMMGTLERDENGNILNNKANTERQINFQNLAKRMGVNLNAPGLLPVLHSLYQNEEVTKYNKKLDQNVKLADINYKNNQSKIGLTNAQANSTNAQANYTNAQTNQSNARENARHNQEVEKQGAARLSLDAAEKASKMKRDAEQFNNPVAQASAQDLLKLGFSPNILKPVGKDANNKNVYSVNTDLIVGELAPLVQKIYKNYPNTYDAAFKASANSTLGKSGGWPVGDNKHQKLFNTLERYQYKYTSGGAPISRKLRPDEKAVFYNMLANNIVIDKKDFPSILRDYNVKIYNDHNDQVTALLSNVTNKVAANLSSSPVSVAALLGLHKNPTYLARLEPNLRASLQAAALNPPPGVVTQEKVPNGSGLVMKYPTNLQTDNGGWTVVPKATNPMVEAAKGSLKGKPPKGALPSTDKKNKNSK